MNRDMAPLVLTMAAAAELVAKGQHAKAYTSLRRIGALLDRVDAANLVVSAMLLAIAAAPGDGALTLAARVLTKPEGDA